MGINNRQRRAAKKRRARDRHQPHGPRWSDAARDGIHLSPRERVSMLLDLAIRAGREGDHGTRAQTVASLATSEISLVAGEAEAILLRAITVAWRNGWQPAELLRQARRESKAGVGVMAAAIAADRATQDGSTIDPRWSAQLESLDLPVVRPGGGWLLGLADPGAPPIELVTQALGALDALRGIGRLAVLIPPPGTPRDMRTVASEPTSDPLLAKVRALLAQAESTNFPAEAETFTAKAQELMARHSIDAALVWDRSARSEQPATIRLPVDDPYADQKALLLGEVAGSLRCRIVILGRYGLVSVTGFATDLTSVEVLYTSLLVQAQSALQAEGRTASAGSRLRSRSFRASFLAAYAIRIGERLAAVSAAVTADAAEAGSLLPVLASRDEAVAAAVDELYPDLHSVRLRRGDDALGWARGRDAADAATIVSGAIPA